MIPPEFFDHAGKLIDYYDGLLGEFDRIRVKKGASEDVSFVFTFDFPRESATTFRKEFRRVRDKLYKTG